MGGTGTGSAWFAFSSPRWQHKHTPCPEGSQSETDRTGISDLVLGGGFFFPLQGGLREVEQKNAAFGTLAPRLPEEASLMCLCVTSCRLWWWWVVGALAGATQQKQSNAKQLCITERTRFTNDKECLAVLYLPCT